MNWLVQLDGTEPTAWKSIDHPSGDGAILQAVTEHLLRDNSPANWPKVAWRSIGNARHPNGAPVCVLKCTLYLQPTKKGKTK